MAIAKVKLDTFMIRVRRYFQRSGGDFRKSSFRWTPDLGTPKYVYKCRPDDEYKSIKDDDHLIKLARKLQILKDFEVVASD